MAKNSQKGKNNKRKKIIVNTNVPQKSKSQKSIQEKRNKDSQKDDTEKKSFWTKFLSIFGIGRKKKNVTKNDEENVEKNNNESSNEKQRNGEDSIPKNGVGENSDKLQTAKDINEEKVEPQRDEKSSELAQDNEVEKTKDTKRKKFLFFWTIGSKKKKDTIPQNENESNRHSNTKNSYEEPLGPQKGNSPFDLGDEGYNQEDVGDKNINATLDQQPNDSSSSKSRAEESKNIDDKDKEKVESENNAVEKSNEIAQNNEVENIKETKGEEVELKNNSDEVSTENTEDVKSIEKNKEDRNNDVSKDAKIKELEAVIKKYKGIEEEYDAIINVLKERGQKMKKAPENYADLLKTLFRDLDGKISDLKNQKGTADSNLEDKEKELGLLRGDLNTKDAEIGSLKNRNELLNSDIEQNKKTIKEKDSTISELEAKIKALGALEAGQLKAKLEESEQTITNLTGEKDALQSKLDETNSQLKTAIDNAQTLKSDLKTTKDELKETKQNLSAEKEEKGRISKDLDKERNRSGELQEKLNQANDAKNEIQKNFDSLSTENEANKKEISRLESVEKDLNTRVATLEQDNIKKVTELNEKKNHIEKVQSQTKEKIVDTFNRLIVALEEGGYEKAIGDLVDACKDDEAFMLSRASALFEDMKNVAINENDDADAILSKMRAFVDADLKNSNDGFILPMARTCAYSYVPFILDGRGEDNIQLVKSKLAIIESLLKRLMGYFGVELIMPVPFIDKLDEGEFEKCDTISNLEYICPNARAHLERVDRKNKSNVIADIVEVGYRIDGEVRSKAKVIL